MSFELSFLSGIIAAFTPCVIVLIPILLYRFFNEKTKDLKNFVYFILGYTIFYLIFGYFLAEIFTSQIQNGFKLGLGFLFIILGLLAIFNKLNPLNFPIIKNPFLLGLTFAIIVSFNPCSIPYLSIIMSISNKYQLFFNLALFGLGTIIPAILFAIFGKSILNISKRTGEIFDKINKLMHFILLFSGIYLIYTIKSFTKYDIYIISIFIILIFLIIIKSFFIINNKKEIFKLKNILILTSLFIILFTAMTHCSNKINEAENINNIFVINNFIGDNQYSCSNDILSCSVCMDCIYKFSFAILIGILGILLPNINIYDFISRNNKNKNKIDKK